MNVDIEILKQTAYILAGFLIIVVLLIWWLYKGMKNDIKDDDPYEIPQNKIKCTTHYKNNYYKKLVLLLLTN